ncbi:hypothetical protein G5V59_01675 [Nocardioides sp. W3-2-3]|nr:hypothetical protein [Nocardioides convexus]
MVFQFTIFNILITLFNVLPGLPLDGGWVLRAGLWKLTRRPILALRIAAWSGRALAVTLVLYLGWQLATGVQARSADFDRVRFGRASDLERRHRRTS